MGASRVNPADELAPLPERASGRSLVGTLEAVRELLGVELAYVTSFDADSQRVRLLAGDGASFGLEADSVIPLEQTYCARVLAGELPNLIPDLQAEPVAAAMPITTTASVGAFASLPLRFRSGEPYGTLCAASHEPRPELGDSEQFLHAFARLAADQIEHEQLQIRAMSAERELAAATALTHAVEARDTYTGEHSQAVLELAAAVADRLQLGGHARRQVARAAELHDVGKIAIPDAVLNKPGPLDDGEWELMRRHPVYGAELIARTPGVAYLAPAIRGEHERWDGAGYPDGLAGEEIPLASRIVLACDAYHAMVTDRPYRPALGEEAAREELVAHAGSQFSPEVVAALLAVLDELPAS